ncbi:MAG TPA: 2-dehydropantoate 2-reductase [Aeromonadales bacterium]|nr:2-dehydropantoate 2-reductase [Aeromonadales bacterium]
MANSSRPTIHILGTGAIGLLCAMDLKKQGFRTHLLTRSGKKYTKNQTVTLKHKKKFSTESFELQASDSLKSPIDILIVCVKAHQLISAIAPCVSHITNRTVILLLQNGMGGDISLLNKYPSILKSQIFHGVNTHAAIKTVPFMVENTGQGSCEIGSVEAPQGHDAIALKKRCCLLLESTFFNRWNKDINTLLWQKLIINAAINPVSALLQCKNGELLEEDIWDIVIKIIEECCIITQRNQIQLSFDRMINKVKQVCISTQNNYSSMAQDILYSRMTEIDFINGYLLRNSQNCSVNFLYNQIVVKLITSRQKQFS